jgi:hypothetical protein
MSHEKLLPSTRLKKKKKKKKDVSMVVEWDKNS